MPFKTASFVSWSLWQWSIDAMGTLTFDVFGIWLIVAAVLVGKFGNGSLKVGSLSLDQAISVLSGAAFTFAFVHLLTSVQFWHVGAYLAFFAALIAFFAGVFTMLPFFSKEFAVRDDVAAHPKARPVTKRAQHPAPVANMPGAHNGPVGFGAPYGGQPNGGQPNGGQPNGGQPNGPIGSQGQPGAPTHSGQPGQPSGPGPYGGQNQFGVPGQPGHQGQYGQPSGTEQFGQHSQPEQHSQPGQFAAPEQNGQPDGQEQFGQPVGTGDNSPYAPPEQQAQEQSFDSAAAADDSAGQAVQSTGSGQTYLGDQHSQDPQHTQSEPTQTFGFGAHREESPWTNDGETAVQAPVPADSSGVSDSKSDNGDNDSSGAGTTAAVAGAGALGVGAAVAGAASARSDSDRSSDSEIGSESERRRGRHAAPSSDADSDADRQADSPTNRIAGDSDRKVGGSEHSAGADRHEFADRGGRAENDSNTTATSSPEESSALIGDDSASPAEGSSFATKVNAHDSDTNVRASEGVALKSEDASNASADSTGSTGSADSVDSAPAGRGVESTTADDATVVSEPAATNAEESGPERATHPEADEPTQYVPVSGYGNSGHSGSGSETGEARGRSGDNAENAPSAPQFGTVNTSSNSSSSSAVDEEETVAQSAVQPGGSLDDRDDRSGESRNDADQDGSNQGSGQNVIQAFWFAVPEPREAVDATTGMPVFTIYPGDWFLGLEDNGSWFKVRDSDGREGLLRNTEGVQRG